MSYKLIWFDDICFLVLVVSPYSVTYLIDLFSFIQANRLQSIKFFFTELRRILFTTLFWYFRELLLKMKLFFNLFFIVWQVFIRICYNCTVVILVKFLPSGEPLSSSLLTRYKLDLVTVTFMSLKSRRHGKWCVSNFFIHILYITSGYKRLAPYILFKIFVCFVRRSTSNVKSSYSSDLKFK